ADGHAVGQRWRGRSIAKGAGYEIAEVIIELAERGQDEDRLWNATPRELIGRLHFSNKIRKRQFAEALAASAMGARGDPKDVKKILKDAERD
ncbi:hypothetical protein, partial [Mesorhizobium sp. M2A.F.Ca.ET.067.02.1.1]|uniref:hypothetical protein n=1 Tax=Mesorhizobium sp. M2A.F.Ca.ET.067.02.1.1 TaxID=2496749 RepID=UPI00167B05B7